MTKIPVDEAPAGPEIDAAIAKLLGCRVGMYPSGEPAPYYCGCGESYPHGDSVTVGLRRYSTDIAAAWPLVEEADLLKDAVLTKNESGQYVICDKYHLYDYPWYYEGQDNQVALVICRAFLKASGIGYIEIPDV